MIIRAYIYQYPSLDAFMKLGTINTHKIYHRLSKPIVQKVRC